MPGHIAVSMDVLYNCSVYGPNGSYPLLPASQPMAHKGMLRLQSSGTVTRHKHKQGGHETVGYIKVRSVKCLINVQQSFNWPKVGCVPRGTRPFVNDIFLRHALISATLSSAF